MKHRNKGCEKGDSKDDAYCNLGILGLALQRIKAGIVTHFQIIHHFGRSHSERCITCKVGKVSRMSGYVCSILV